MLKLIVGFGLGYLAALVVTVAKESNLTGFVPHIIRCSKEEMDNVIQIDTKRG